MALLNTMVPHPEAPKRNQLAEPNPDERWSIDRW
jgi:hypothetical protein